MLALVAELGSELVPPDCLCSCVHYSLQECGESDSSASNQPSPSCSSPALGGASACIGTGELCQYSDKSSK